MATPLRFLRPYTYRSLATANSSRRSAYLSFYELAVKGRNAGCLRKQSTYSRDPSATDEYTAKEHSAFVANRIARLKEVDSLQYPRVVHKKKRVAVEDFCEAYNAKSQEELSTLEDCVTVTGRVMHVRRFGSKFFFVHIRDNGRMLQIQVNWGKLQGSEGSEYSLSDFKKLSKTITRGDFISVTGRPRHTETNELCLEAQYLPQITSFSLAPLPYHLPEASRMPERHLDLIVNPSSRDVMVARSRIIRTLRDHLQTRLRFIEVQTPILAASAGGALARPFETRATDFLDKELALRIAPELWLKRLVAGGLERVFEIGSAFRNEGLDATHNPEFTMCEFYASHANLQDLIEMTMDLFQDISQDIHSYAKNNNFQLEIPSLEIFAKENFKQAEFIPALQEELGYTLPDLSSPTALSEILEFVRNAGIELSLSPEPTLAKLLDLLASKTLEPQSETTPLFITHHPACMSPLSKSFTCPITNQQVSARAELFYRSNELANMYEEENDPFEQRRKFVEQNEVKAGQQLRNDNAEPPHAIDEQYIRVLESGLPPTGGWGCGIDRLVMLFTGAKRISDVLAFGSLRNVVGLASVGSQPNEK